MSQYGKHRKFMRAPPVPLTFPTHTGGTLSVVLRRLRDQGHPSSHTAFSARNCET